MKGDDSEIFFAMNHLPPVIRSLYYFPRSLARAAHTPCNEDDEKRQGDSHFFSNDTEPLFSDRIIDLQRRRLSINKKEMQISIENISQSKKNRRRINI